MLVKGQWVVLNNLVFYFPTLSEPAAVDRVFLSLLFRVFFFFLEVQLALAVEETEEANRNL